MELELTHISLFAGIGGIDLAAEWAGFRTILFVEINPFCQRVLRKHWPDVPIIGDIRDATKERIEEAMANPVSNGKVGDKHTDGKWRRVEQEGETVDNTHGGGHVHRQTGNQPSLVSLVGRRVPPAYSDNNNHGLNWLLVLGV